MATHSVRALMGLALTCLETLRSNFENKKDIYFQNVKISLVCVDVISK